MIAATTSYQDVNTLSTKQAGKLINDAIIHRPGELNTMTGSIVRQLGIFAPKLNKLIFSTLYQITDDSEAAKSSAHQHSPEEDKEIRTHKALDALATAASGQADTGIHREYPARCSHLVVINSKGHALLSA